MAKDIEIQILQPCYEDWNKMTDETQGRHCNSFKKTVIDFTMMIDEHLVNFFNKKQATQLLINQKGIFNLRVNIQCSSNCILLSIEHCTSNIENSFRDFPIN